MPRSVVVTGGTRGIGLGLARAFLAQGCTMTLCGRSEGGVDQAVRDLSAEHSPGTVAGIRCDVARIDDVERLWGHANDRFGGIDIWVNNAGLSHRHVPAWELSPDELSSVVGANLMGTLFGSQVAVSRMTTQGRGQLWNMEGAGSDGNARPGTGVYAATKSAIRTLTRTLMQEVQGSPVQVGLLSPGMVMTELLVPDSANVNEHARKAFNVLADTVDTVAPWLVAQMLETTESGAEVRWLTEEKIAARWQDPAYLTRELV